jgi:hypothetical protein
MSELHIKGEVKKVINMNVSGSMIDEERNRALTGMLETSLGRAIRVTKIEVKEKKTIFIIEQQ